MLNLAQRSDRQFVSTLEVVGLAEFQPSVSIIGIKADGFAIVLHFFFGSSGEHAAYVIFQGVQAHLSNAGDVLVLRHGKVGADETKQIPSQRGLQAANIGQGRGFGGGGRELLSSHVEQLGDGRQALAVIAIGAEHGVIDIHLLGEAVEGGARSMNAGRNALTIIGPESLVTAGQVQDRRIKLLVESFGKRFAEPFQARRGRSILERNHNHGVTDDDAADRTPSGSGAVLGKKRRAEKQANHKDEDSGAFHDKLIIWGRETHEARRWPTGTNGSVVPSASGGAADLRRGWFQPGSLSLPVMRHAPRS